MRQSSIRWARDSTSFRCVVLILSLLTLAINSVSVSTESASASGISNDRAKAVILNNQIQSTNDRVNALGEEYDLAHIRLNVINGEIASNKNRVATIESDLARVTAQLRTDAIFAYVTSVSAQGVSTLYFSNPTESLAAGVYDSVAEGNVEATLASLKSDKIKLTQEGVIITSEDRQAEDAATAAQSTFQKAHDLLNSLQRALSDVNGAITKSIREENTTAAAPAAAPAGRGHPGGKI